MNLLIRSAAVFLAISGGFASLRAQSIPPLVGQWNIQFQVGTETEGGETTPIMEKAALTIMQAGDTLTATLVRSPRPDGTIPPPRIMEGRLDHDSVVFTHPGQATITTHLEARTIQVKVIWTLQVKGDSLTGSRQLEGMPVNEGPTPVKGTRSKA